MLRDLFTRLFGRSGAPPAAETPHHPRPPASAPASAPPPASAAPGLTVDNINLAFFQLAGADPNADVPLATERLILEALLRLVKSPDSAASLVPRVPAVIPPLLRSLRDTTLSGADIARQISQDVVLVAEVIREANSPYYSPATPIRNLEGAVMLLGQNGLRMLLARVAFRPVISQQTGGRFARLAAPAVWTQAEKCALAASILAYEQGAEPFEAYLAGLMENTGLIVAFRMIDQAFGEQGALPSSPEFCRTLFAYARMISARVAMLWEFPSNVVAAIAHAGEDAAPLALTLGRADRISKLRMLADDGRIGVDAATAGMDATELNCFHKLKDKETD